MTRPDDRADHHTFPGRQHDGQIPGPDLDHVWVRHDRRHLVLANVDGSPTSTTLRLPEGIVGNPQPDGHGYVLVQSHQQAYDLRPAHSTRLATGRLIAAGPGRLLINDCVPGLGTAWQVAVRP